MNDLKMIKEQTKIVLVEPMGAINLGSVARLCANFGINELRLVSPRCSTNDPEARKMALKGIKLLEQAKKYNSLIDAIEDCSRVIATCGRKDHGDIPIYKTDKTLQWFISNPQNITTAIIFGREDCGLTNQELLLANKVISLQTSTEYPSLNLSHAVAIILHELNRLNYNDVNTIKTNSNKPAFPKQLGDFLSDSEKLLLEIGFLLEHTKLAKMSKIKSFLQRAEIRSEEIALLRGILRQMRWAIKNKKI